MSNSKKWREANKEQIKEYNKLYREKNKEKIALYQKEYHEKNKEWKNANAKEHSKQRYHNIKNNDPEKYQKIVDAKKEYTALNREKSRLIKSKWVKNNPEKDRALKAKNQKKRYKEDLGFKLRSNVSKSIWGYIKKNGSSKNKQSFAKFLPYTIQTLISHLESQFEPWMTWENWGKYKAKTHNEKPNWQIDHIIPVSYFKFTSMDSKEFRMCWSLKNLRPLDARKNMSKRNKIENPELISILEQEQKDLEKGNSNEM